MQHRLFSLIIIICLFGSCLSNNKNDDAGEETVAFLTEVEEQELSRTKVNSDIDAYHYPDIITKSAPKLDLIKQKWMQEALLCARGEIFLTVRKITNHRFIALSVLENDNQSFQFYDFGINGNVFHRSILPKADYYINNRFNFIVENDSVFYFINKKDSLVYHYSIEYQEHSKASKNKVDWDKINDWKSSLKYPSPNNKSVISFYDTQLILEREKYQTDTIINQVYDGSWSFGKGTWSSDSEKFYFDNSGAVECIWELNIKDNTLDKIVSYHWAKAPLFVDDDKDAVLYCYENCVYITRKED